jgi:tetratricopeptide (TPR) repeat protein
LSRAGLLLAAAAGLVLVGPARSAAPSPGQRPAVESPGALLRLDSQVMALVNPTHDSNTARCDAPFNSLLIAAKDPLFDRLPAATRRSVLRVTLACVKREKSAPGLDLLRRLEPQAEGAREIGDANELLMDDDYRRGDHPGSARRLIRIIDADPTRVGGWWPRYINQIVYGEGISDDPQLSIALFQRISTLAWTDRDSAIAARNGWANRYAELLADRGDLAGAGRAIAGVDSTALWMAIAQDRRFAPLWPKLAAEGRFDWRKRAEAELTGNLTRRAEEPLRLDLVQEGLQLLRQLQRHDEAIAIGQDYRRRLKAGETFAEKNRYANWLLNELAYALLDTGKVAEAEAVFLDAIAAGEQDGTAVSQRINWAEELNDLGRPNEALAILQTLDPVRTSPYGRMWADAAIACALTVTGGDGLEPLLDSMRGRRDDNPAGLTQALICANRLDEAAALYIHRLRTARRRGGVIEAFRIVLPPPVLTPREAELEQRRQTVLARPEVLAALNAVGRRIEVPLAGGYWGAI